MLQKSFILEITHPLFTTAYNFPIKLSYKALLSLPHLSERKLLFITENIKKYTIIYIYIEHYTHKYRNNFDVAILTVRFDASRGRNRKLWMRSEA